MHRNKKKSGGRRINTKLLSEFPVRYPDTSVDKDKRGVSLLVGGSRELIGAPILAANSALRAGTGKIQIASPKSIATLLGTTVQEARVLGLRESSNGNPLVGEFRQIAKLFDFADAVLVGPGLVEARSLAKFIEKFLVARKSQVVILDAAALTSIPLQMLKTYGHENIVITPHCGELATLAGKDKEEIELDPYEAARAFAMDVGVTTILKGRTTYIATPAGKVFRNDSGNVGLATSGSGDSLAGTLLGFASRCGTPLCAAIWAVHLHGEAAESLAERNAPRRGKALGGLGLLARELSSEIPRLVAKHSKREL